ncbi:hypothetical protein NN3_44150 [Nocardia neocaledoniensis NBRC 108232]|uniref:Uncharacterized protein DUF3558 n=1 Tax=Nocardia neocaledoniensis TaxID=236511 RepID=A0A317NMC6_9NOCA|nr:DUF3558 domain-containing protein [Nocardia neocaledoniensis]PWV75943.1 uncharacterized protein DUF3558 [Nocardia neocaledoniensis]GEM33408.1 hypothetical protein NN3_44150 [Nocardia neocaledoniensis NBRC 108232]
MKRTGTALLVAGLAVAGLAGCESEQTSSQGSTTTAAPALWNPCTEIPDDVLRSAGVDPGTEEKGVGGHDQSGWEICAWDAPEYALTVYTTNKTVEQFEQKPGNTEFRNVTIAGRAGREFKVEGASKDLGCDVVFPAQQGVVQLEILNSPLETGLEDPCVFLQRVGEVLVPILPN